MFIKPSCLQFLLHRINYNAAYTNNKHSGPRFHESERRVVWNGHAREAVTKRNGAPFKEGNK